MRAAPAAWLSSSGSTPQQHTTPPAQEMPLLSEPSGRTSGVPCPQNTSGVPKAWDPMEAGAEKHQSEREKKDPLMASKGLGNETFTHLGN